MSYRRSTALGFLYVTRSKVVGLKDYFDPIALTPSDRREKAISRWAGARMAGPHSVRISAVEGSVTISSQKGTSQEMGVKKNTRA